MAVQHSTLDGDGLDLIFRDARTHYSWTDEAVPVELLRRVYDLMKWAPTGTNSSPARFVFISSEAAKQRLAPAIPAGNLDKVMQAPVTAIIAMDMRFHEHLLHLFPHKPGMAAYFAGDAALSDATAFRNSSLQAAYFIIAARALGLDCGPIGGFDETVVNKTFFPDGRFKVNFLCNLGHGDGEGQFPRAPRLAFEEACRLL
jgi:3-hydroxypropanoate dehydrogenase